MKGSSRQKVRDVPDGAVVVRFQDHQRWVLESEARQSGMCILYWQLSTSGYSPCHRALEITDDHHLSSVAWGQPCRRAQRWGRGRRGGVAGFGVDTWLRGPTVSISARSSDVWHCYRRRTRLYCLQRRISATSFLRGSDPLSRRPAPGRRFRAWSRLTSNDGVDDLRGAQAMC